MIRAKEDSSAHLNGLSCSSTWASRSSSFKNPIVNLSQWALGHLNLGAPYRYRKASGVSLDSSTLAIKYSIVLRIVAVLASSAGRASSRPASHCDSTVFKLSMLELWTAGPGRFASASEPETDGWPRQTPRTRVAEYTASNLRSLETFADAVEITDSTWCRLCAFVLFCFLFFLVSALISTSRLGRPL